MMKPLYPAWLVTLICLWLSAVVVAQEDAPLIVVTHDSFNVSAEVLDAFTAETGIVVEILRAGDAGQVVNQAVLTRGNPLGDVLFGVDNTFLSRALAADLFIPYESPLLERVAPEFLPDFGAADGDSAAPPVTPITYGDVCLNYDMAYFETHEVPLPDSLADLVRPEYRGLLVTMNPATSSPGLAFLLATVAAFGTEGDYTYLDFWAELLANEVLIVEGWEQAYFTHFTAGGGGGTYPLVVSYASSPPFTYDAETDAATTASITAPGTCFRQIEFAGILRGTAQPEAAQQFIDFMLGDAFQSDLPLQMYVFPVVTETVLPELFERFATVAEVPAVLPYADIESNRDEWIAAWLETVLRD